MYIHELDNWTDFRWDNDSVALLLDEVTREQGRLYGRLDRLGFDSQMYAVAENLTRDVLFSSEIEGVRLNEEEVRSSIARRLGIESVKRKSSSRYIDAVVSVMLDAMEHYDYPLTKQKLCAWQSAFFSMGYSNGAEIEVGRYRTHEEHIVSGFLGRERVHYVAPSPDRVEDEMTKFIHWFNSASTQPSVIRSAIAHFWFVSIHPFEDGNGRLARILGDILLARGDKSRFRFYNVSSEINLDKNHYYNVLEQMQRGDGDITPWIEWYLRTLLASIKDASATVSVILNKSLFWMRMGGVSLSERQRMVLNMFLDGYEAKMTSKKWAELAHCSTDTANRDLQDLVRKGLIVEDIPGAKRPSYSVNYGGSAQQTDSRFTDVRVQKESNVYYLMANYRGSSVCERILKLDGERYERGDLSLSLLMNKYLSYYTVEDWAGNSKGIKN